MGIRLVGKTDIHGPLSDLKKDREFKDWERQYSADVIVIDSRAKTNIVEGSITNWTHNEAFLFLDINTGYEIKIAMKSLLRIIDKLVSEEVIKRLKGEENDRG